MKGPRYRRTKLLARCMVALSVPGSGLFLLASACSPGSRDSVPALQRAWIGPSPESDLTDLSPAALDQAKSQSAPGPYRIELENEVREGLLAWPGRRHELDVEVGRGSHFAAALGQIGGEETDRAILFEVVAFDPQGRKHVLFHSVEQRLVAWKDIELDLRRFAGLRLRIELKAEVEGLERPSDPVPVWAHPAVVSPSNQRPPDLILISIDTLRADHLSLAGYRRPTTPHLDAWARRHAATFTQAIAQAPWTLPSHVSMLSGVNALGHDSNFGEPAAPEMVFLTELLRQAGYRSLADTGGAWLHPQYRLSQGFEVYRYRPATGGEGPDFDRAIDRAIAWLERSHGQPSFVFLHTYAVHEPYQAQPQTFERVVGKPSHADVFSTTRLPPVAGDGWKLRQWLQRKSPNQESAVPLAVGEVGEVIDAYDSQIADLDQRLSRLLSWLKSSGRLATTAVVITSDHGEAFGEKGLAGHAQLHDVLLRVPLILALPEGKGAGLFIDRQVRSIDIAPTLMEVAKIATSRAIDGRSLVDLVDNPRADFPREAWSYAPSSNTGVALRIDGRLKYIFNHSAWAPRPQREEAYPLESGLAEEELATAFDDLASVRRHVAATLEQRQAGLELTFENREGEPWIIWMTGSAVVLQRVKSWQADSRELVWQGRRRGAEILVPAHSLRTLRLTIEPRGSLELRAAEGAAPLILDVAALQKVAHFAANGPVWQSVAGLESALRGVTIAWKGQARPELRESNEEIDPELARQLEALGYRP